MLHCHDRVQRSFSVLKSTTALSTTVIVALGLQSAAMAQSAPSTQKPAQAAADQIEEIVVSGSRIVREGYEAPTPLAVVGEEQLKSSADSNLVYYLQTQPVFVGSQTGQNSVMSLSGAQIGVNSLNLRSLGINRTLVLLDGRRVEPAATNGITDVSSLPTQLISRVDVVTGGASAVYGSDAIAGVVNFVLDRNFTGIKGEVNGGVTSYGDYKNYTINLAGGFGFADNRGHILISGEMFHSDGVAGRSRNWSKRGTTILTNPLYTATNGQPEYLQLDRAAYVTGGPGGTVLNANGTLINSGPLARIIFGEGGATQRLGSYGTIVGLNGVATGGQWETNDVRFQQIIPEESRENLFLNVSYDITDSIQAYAQFSYAHSYSFAVEAPNQTYGSAGATIRLDNAFLPTTVRDLMIQAGVTQIKVGSMNQDLGTITPTTSRRSKRYLGGFKGDVEAFGTKWSWDAYYSRGETRAMVQTPGNIRLQNYYDAADSIVVNGVIQCRNLAARPDCLPWNVFGTGVNNPNGAAIKFIQDKTWSSMLITQDVFGATLAGEPFSLPAGPVSIAADAQYRRNSVRSTRDATSAIPNHSINNAPLVNGSTNVKEIGAETIIPLVKGASWADSWDVSAAARFTSYNLAGDVVTWKGGTTFSPVPDIKFRGSYSRDIRAPTATENFDTGTVTRVSFQDPKYRTGPLITQFVTGNLNLRPEDARNLTIGAVLQPSFFEGFSFSADYWTIDIKDVISAVSTTNIVAYCLNGTRPDFCANVVRDPVTDVLLEIHTGQINFASNYVRGLDLESTYRTSLEGIGIPGELTIHGNMSFNFEFSVDSGVVGIAPVDSAGTNGSSNPPKWRVNVATTYALDDWRFTLTARGFPGGKAVASYFECTSGCPTSTQETRTVNNNHLAGAFYLDASVNYDLKGDAYNATVYLNVKNLVDHDPPNYNGSQPMGVPAPFYLYDFSGRTFRAGIRFKI